MKCHNCGDRLNKKILLQATLTCDITVDLSKESAVFEEDNYEEINSGLKLEDWNFESILDNPFEYMCESCGFYIESDMTKALISKKISNSKILLKRLNEVIKNIAVIDKKNNAK